MMYDYHIRGLIRKRVHNEKQPDLLHEKQQNLIIMITQGGISFRFLEKNSKNHKKYSNYSE